MGYANWAFTWVWPCHGQVYWQNVVESWLPRTGVTAVARANADTPPIPGPGAPSSSPAELPSWSMLGAPPLTCSCAGALNPLTQSWVDKRVLTTAVQNALLGMGPHSPLAAGFSRSQLGM